MKSNCSQTKKCVFKNGIITCILFLLTLSGFAQELNFRISGKYERTVRTAELRNARFIGDFIAGYPSSWIDYYDSVEIVINSGGKIIRPKSANDSLTTEQKNILKATQPGSDIDIHIDYQTRNAVTGLFEKRKINISVTVIPDVEAEYAGGNEKMRMYLKEQVINKIPVSKSKKFQPLVVLFAVSEAGEIVSARLSKSCGNPKIDKLAVEAITKMPNWKPAEWPKGIKVKQEFQFSVGESGC